jgi:large subunit ribosomal protein L47
MIGRAWIASELRLKSHEDLHKLWYVLQKERNLLITKRQDCRRQGIPFIDKGRLIKVSRLPIMDGWMGHLMKST